MARGKKYQDSIKLIDKAKFYDVKEAIELVQETAKAKFDESIEVHVKLGVDSRHADQQVRGVVVLPHGTGKTLRVLVFAKGDKVKEAEAAGFMNLKGHRLVGGMRASIYNAMSLEGVKALVDFMDKFAKEN